MTGGPDWVPDGISGLDLAVRSPATLDDTLTKVDVEALTQRMDSWYSPGVVRRLDNPLLSAFGDTRVELRGNANRAPLRVGLEEMPPRLSRSRGH